MVRTMLQTPAMLDVTLPAGSRKKTSQLKDELAGLEKNIIWLNLSDNGFTDGDLAFLKQLSNLEKLRLEKNPLTDSISGDLAGLHHLEAVNLNETKLTNSGLARLEKNPTLKRIYTWKTAVKQP
jgi:Leucine-rich repeat (LRR) protein